MAWNDISSIPWLAGDPVEKSTAAGLRGAQIGSMIARSWAQGQEGRRQDEQSQREAELQPLRIKAAQTQAQLQALQIANTLFERDMAVKAMTGVTKLSSVMEGITDWAAPETERAINQVLGAYPALDKTDAMAAARESIKIARKAKADILTAPFLTKAVDADGNPTGVEVLQTAPNRFAQVRPAAATSGDTATIKDITRANEMMKHAVALEFAGDLEGAKSMRADAALLKGTHAKNETETNGTTAMKDIAHANELLKRAAALDVEGKPAEAKALRDDALLLKEAHVKSGWTIQSDGQGGLTIMQGNTKIPPMVTGRVLERLSQTEKAIDNLDDLAATLRPQDVGFKGVLGELFLDKILPQLGTATSDVKRMDNRTKLRTLAENLMRQVSADSRFSNADRLAISRILPSSGVVESFEHTQQTIITLRKILAKRALIDNKEAGQAPSPFAVRSLDDRGLQEAVQSDLMTREQGSAEFFRRNPNLAPAP